jgi:hypothetical protein
MVAHYCGNWLQPWVEPGNSQAPAKPPAQRFTHPDISSTWRDRDHDCKLVRIHGLRGLGTARIVQSCAHLAPVSTVAVYLRFSAFVVQTGLAAYWAAKLQPYFLPELLGVC